MIVQDKSGKYVTESSMDVPMLGVLKNSTGIISDLQTSATCVASRGFFYGEGGGEFVYWNG